MHMLSDPNAVKLETNQLAKLARYTARAATKALIAAPRDGGTPFVTSVRVACRHDGAPLLQLHGDQAPTDGQATVLFRNKRGALLVGVQGSLNADPEEADRARYFRRQTGAEAADSSLGLYALDVARAYVEAEDGSVRWLEASEYLFDASDATELAKSEASIIEHVNGGHPGSIHAVVSYHGLGADDWVLIGCDPEGIDVARGRRIARVTLNKIVRSREDFKYAMIEMRQIGGGTGMPEGEAAAAE